jgi:hypothetical protein
MKLRTVSPADIPATLEAEIRRIEPRQKKFARP